MKRCIILLAALLILTLICPAYAATEEESLFELPIEGATGYCLVDCNMRAEDSSKSTLLKVVPAGTPYTILTEGVNYFYGRLEDGTEGWLSKVYAMVNLPDIIPSIVYNATNSYGSLYRCLNRSIANVTGESLYEGRTYNARLEREEYMMPVLYAMAKKIATAQRSALAEGNTLVLYEGYRPQAVQSLVCGQLSAMANSDAEIYHAISDKPWSISWFIATGISNHQKGYAVDVSLARIEQSKTVDMGSGYTYTQVVKHSEYEMPSNMHELSPLSARYTGPVSSLSETAWKSAKHAASFNEAAQLLERYCTEAGLVPLPSEWWHFNDVGAYKATANAGTGNFYITKTLSEPFPGQKQAAHDAVTDTFVGPNSLQRLLWPQLRRFFAGSFRQMLSLW